MPNRPDKGGVSGKSINVKVNIFPVTQLSATKVYQYDIAITPELPAEVCRRIFRQAELLIKQKDSKAWMVYDGLKNAYSTCLFPDSTFEIFCQKDVDMTIPPIASQGGRGGSRGGRGDSGRGRGDSGRGRGDSGRGRGDSGHGRGGSSGSAGTSPNTLTLAPAVLYTEATCPQPAIKVKMVIRKTVEISMHELLLFAAGKGQETEGVIHSTQALSILLRHLPSMLFVPVGSEFYSPENRIPISGNLEIWRGAFI